MNRSSEPTDLEFVPVTEALRARAVAARQGEVWSGLHIAFLAMVTLVAAALRLWHVEVWSVSAPESALWQRMVAGPSPVADALAASMRFLWDSGLLPGHGEGSLRLPFVFAGTIAAPLLALVGEPFVGRRPALLAAALLAVHPLHIEASQSANGVVAAVSVALLGLGAVHAAIVLRKVGVGILAALLSVLAGACHASGLLGVLVVIAVAIWLKSKAAERRERVRMSALGAAVAGGAVAVARYLRPAGPGAAADVGVATTALVDFAHGVGPTVLLFAVVGALAAHARTRAIHLAFVVVVPLLMLWLIGAVAIRVTPDMALLTLPPLLLAAATGAMALADAVRLALGGGRRLRVLAPAVLGVLAVLLEPLIGTYLYATARGGSRPDWRAAAEVVVDATRQRTFAVLAGEGHASLMYYLRPEHARPGPGDPHPGIAIVPYNVRDDIAPFTAYATTNGGDMFLVLLEAEVRDFQRANARSLASFRRVAVLPCGGEAGDEAVSVFRFRRPD